MVKRKKKRSKARRPTLSPEEKKGLRRLNALRKKMLPKAVQEAIEIAALSPAGTLRGELLRAALDRTRRMALGVECMNQFEDRILHSEDGQALLAAHAAFASLVREAKSGAAVGVEHLDTHEGTALRQVLDWFAQVIEPPPPPPDDPDEPENPARVMVA